MNPLILGRIMIAAMATVGVALGGTLIALGHIGDKRDTADVDAAELARVAAIKDRFVAEKGLKPETVILFKDDKGAYRLDVFMKRDGAPSLLPPVYANLLVNVRWVR
jgi:hypothetical protein